jgi:hypothetical protein
MAGGADAFFAGVAPISSLLREPVDAPALQRGLFGARGGKRKQSRLSAPRRGRFATMLRLAGGPEPPAFFSPAMSEQDQRANSAAPSRKCPDCATGPARYRCS